MKDRQGLQLFVSPVIHRTFRAQNQDGGVHFFGAHLFDQRQAVPPEQHEIDDGRIVRFRQGEAETFLAVRGVDPADLNPLTIKEAILTSSSTSKTLIGVLYGCC
jgi:hypothetical protein